MNKSQGDTSSGKDGKNKRVVNTRFAKGEEYSGVLESIETEGECPFCPDNFKYHKHPTLKNDDRWFLTKCSWPYENASEHFLIISKIHKELFSDLSNDDLKSVRLLADWVIKEFDLEGGAIALRFGDTEHTGATVCHLHFHFIVPEVGKTVNFPIG